MSDAEETQTMPMPMEYANASNDFDRFLSDVRDSCMLQTTHQAYQTLRAVLHVFRSHIAAADALLFANALPPVTRAIFVEDWTLDELLTPFPSRAELTGEVLAVRGDHNLSPETAISDVAGALRRAIDPRDLDRALAKLPAAAQDFWRVP
jgi:uncharacterized protein (DUF2267 family)